MDARSLLAASLLITTMLTPMAAMSVPDTTPILVPPTGMTLEGAKELTRPIVVPPGATLEIRDAQIRFAADTGCRVGLSVHEVCVQDIDVRGTLVVTNSSLAGASQRGGAKDWRIGGESGTVHVTQSTLTGGTIRIQGSAIGPSTFVDSHYQDTARALDFSRGAYLEVVSSTFSGVTDPLYVKDTFVKVTENTFTDGGASEFHATRVGEKIPWKIRYDITDNVFADNTGGLIHVGNLASQIADNTFQRNIFGVSTIVDSGPNSVRDGVPTLTGNTFDDNQRAWSIHENVLASDDETWHFTAHRNSFLDSNCIKIHVGAEVDDITVDARYNWWGSSLGPLDRTGCPAVDGDGVQVDPWLTTAP